MTVRIDSYPPHHAVWHRPWWRRRWTWLVIATRGGTQIAHRTGYARTRIGATIARDRAADRLRAQHGGAA